MMYGAIGLGYKSKLIICSSGANAIEYHNIIQEAECSMFLAKDTEHATTHLCRMGPLPTPQLQIGYFLRKDAYILQNGQ